MQDHLMISCAKTVRLFGGMSGGVCEKKTCISRLPTAETRLKALKTQVFFFKIIYAGSSNNFLRKDCPIIWGGCPGGIV